MRKAGKILIRILVLLFVLAICGGAYLFYNSKKNEHFITTFYSMETEKEISNLRIVLLSDLHLKEYGEGNCELIDKIQALAPDLIAITGDMNIDNVDEYEPIITLLNGITTIAPVYYVPGNHEWSGAYNNGHQDMIEAIRQTDAVYMENSYQQVQIGENTLYIGGVYGYADKILTTDWSKNMLDNFCAEEGFKLLLCHFPEVFIDALAEYPVDLALCGHAHGGQIRLPFTDGLWCEDQGFLPKYTSGLHTIHQTTVCISRGLGDSDYRIPRINNQPELVVIDING